LAATPLRELKAAQLATIEAHKHLRTVAHEFLNQALSQKRNARQQAPASPPPPTTPLRALRERQLADNLNRMTLKNVLQNHPNAPVESAKVAPKDTFRITLSPKLAAFVLQQVEEGYYRDPSEVINDCLRRMQAQSIL
jgi:hypothetical protein